MAEINGPEPDADRESREGREREQNLANTTLFSRRNGIPAFDLVVFRRVYALINEEKNLNETLRDAFARAKEIAWNQVKDIVRRHPDNKYFRAAYDSVMENRERLQALDPRVRELHSDVEPQIRLAMFVHYCMSKYEAWVTDAEFHQLVDPEITLGELKLLLENKRVPGGLATQTQKRDDEDLDEQRATA